MGSGGRFPCFVLYENVKEEQFYFMSKRKKALYEKKGDRQFIGMVLW